MADVLPRVTVYTDGACEPNPGAGGWAAILLRDGEEPKQLCGCDERTTNNRMELRAALEALQALPEPHHVTLLSDSTYLVDGLTKLRPGPSPGLFGAAESARVNGDLWDELAVEKARHQLECRWVAGHSGDNWNEIADKLARAHIPKPKPARSADRAVHVQTAICEPDGPQSGSWAVILDCEGHRKPLAAVVPGASAMRLHLLAAVEGLRGVRPTARRVVLMTPSEHVHHGLTRWYGGWVERDWRTTTGKPVLHRDLWESLKAEADRLKATCQRCAFGGTGLIVECLELARAAVQGQVVPGR
jgi:ribonuclease HI